MRAEHNTSFEKQFIRKNYNNNIVSCLKRKSIIISIDRVDKHWFAMMIIIMILCKFKGSHKHKILYTLTLRPNPRGITHRNSKACRSFRLGPLGLTILYCWPQSTLYLYLYKTVYLIVNCQLVLFISVGNESYIDCINYDIIIHTQQILCYYIIQTWLLL